MKATIASVLVLAVTTFVADARLINGRSYKDLDKLSDMIVIAKPVSTRDTDEKTILPNISPDTAVVGLSSEFETVVVFKGAARGATRTGQDSRPTGVKQIDRGLKKFVVHHYRLADPKAQMMNSPNLASFEPTESTRYLLFLQREPDGRYAPFDQVDPALTCIFKLSGSEWDKMTADDFKNWIDAKRWLREGPLSRSGISPEITPEGKAEGSLHEAAMNGKLEKARALLKTNPDLVFSHASYARFTPLQFAAEYGHKDVAELLLANKAEVEAMSNGGWTPLLSAVFGGHKDMVELLLKNKADVNHQEEVGRSALHVAAENGYTEIAALLLANKADVTATNRDGDTPLHIAVALGHKDLVELLLAHRADVNARGNKGRTPLSYAVLHNHKDLVELLREQGGEE